MDDSMFEKLSDNLNQLMAEMRISADELARRTNIPASTIKKIRNRYNPNPTLTTLLPLAKFFLITLGQLVGEEPLPQSRLKGSYQPDPSTYSRIPLIEWADAPHPSQAQTNHFVTTEYNYSANSFALSVIEDDWENLTRGTILIIDPLIKPAHRDFIILHKETQKIPTLKQILFDEDQSYLKSIISGYNITTMTPGHRILGVVVEYKKNLKPIHSVTKEKIA
jgi:transcriptional regulator with XRE-family HTH domain